VQNSVELLIQYKPLASVGTSGLEPLDCNRNWIEVVVASAAFFACIACIEYMHYFSWKLRLTAIVNEYV